MKSKVFYNLSLFCFMSCMFMLAIATMFDTVTISAPYIMAVAGIMGVSLFIGLIKEFVLVGEGVADE